MPENSNNTALAAVVNRLGDLTESELRQLHLIVGVRLGFPDGASGVLNPKTSAAPAGKSGKGKQTRAKGSKSAKAKGVGNPQRKSQWVKHPLYQEYSRLKKVVESQSKEQKCSFNKVDTAESRAYRAAFTQWVEAKHSFRGRQTASKANSDSDDESEEEGEPGPAVHPVVQGSGPADRSYSSLPARPEAAATGGLALRKTPA
jgi:hypothetical protein